MKPANATSDSNQPGSALRLLRRVLKWGFVSVVLAGLIADLATYNWIGERTAPSIFFSLSYEQNLPSWYSASLLLVCAILLGAIAIVQRVGGAIHTAYWWGLAAIFTYISLDETTSIHERLNGMFQLRGMFFFDWILIAGAFLIVLWLILFRFIAHLDAAVRVRFLVAGSIYVFGALVMELPLGAWTDAHGADNLTYFLIDWVEESMEILGISLFLHALARYLGERVSWRVAETKGLEIRQDRRTVEEAGLTACRERSR